MCVKFPETYISSENGELKKKIGCPKILLDNLGFFSIYTKIT
jgi:hypothetical protein